MNYAKERSEFIARASAEGLDLPLILKLLRHATTLQRLAEAQCNGDWPADNGERKVIFCPKCESGFVRSSFVRSDSFEVDGKKVKVCPDCRTCELVCNLFGAQEHMRIFRARAKPPYTCDCLAVSFNDCRTCGVIKPVFGGDPRGAVLRLRTPNYPCDNNGAYYGLYVPARAR